MIYYEAYFRIYPQDTLEDFEKYVHLNVLGDDNICGVEPERALFGVDSVVGVMIEWGIIPKLESLSNKIEGVEYLSKVIGRYEDIYYRPLIPLPKRVRMIAHYLYSNPGPDILRSAVKCNSIMFEGVFHKDIWDMMQTFQYWYRDKVNEMLRWETEDVTIQSFIASIFPRSMVLSAYIGYQEKDESLNLASLYKKLPEEMPKVLKRIYQSAQKAHGAIKKVMARRKEIVQKVSHAGSAVGAITSKIVPLVRNVPVVGQVAQAVDFAANTVIPFLSSMFGQVAYLHITRTGKRMMVKHSHVRYNEELKEGVPVPAGSILIKMPITIGPEDSRSRIAGSNFEKVAFKHYSISIEPNAPATQPGSLLFVYVPDPLDKRIEEEPVDNRLTIAMAYQKQLKLQLFARGEFNLTGGQSGIPRKQYYIHDDTGSERLTTPGVVYILAASEIDMTLLPTVRLKTSMAFSQSAVKSNYDVDIRGELKMAEVCAGTVEYWTADAASSFEASAWETSDRLLARLCPSMQAGYRITYGPVSIASDLGLLVKKGEVAYMAWSVTQSNPGGGSVNVGGMLAWPVASSRPTIQEVNSTTEACVVETDFYSATVSGVTAITRETVITARDADIVVIYHTGEPVSRTVLASVYIESAGAVDPNLLTMSKLRRLISRDAHSLRLLHPSTLTANSVKAKIGEDAVVVQRDEEEVRSVSSAIAIPRVTRR